MSFGTRDTWQYSFDEIARSKAFQTWRTGLSTREIQTNAPWLYKKVDTRYVGSIAFGHDGRLVIAVSGFEEYFDEMIGHRLTAAIEALCREKVEALRGSKSDWIGGPC